MGGATSVWGYQALPATPHMYPSPHGEGCKQQSGGSRLCLLRPTSVGSPLGVPTLPNKSHRSVLPEGTPVGQKTQIQNSKDGPIVILFTPAVGWENLQTRKFS